MVTIKIYYMILSKLQYLTASRLPSYKRFRKYVGSTKVDIWEMSESKPINEYYWTKNECYWQSNMTITQLMWWREPRGERIATNVHQSV
jgi:hypothetical protein